MSKKIHFVYVDEKQVLPRCPYCKEDLNEICIINKGLIEQKPIYLCPHCRTLLGIGYNFGM